MKALMVMCAALLSAPAWAVNKCTGPGGEIVFQDTPCADSGVTVSEGLEQQKAATAREKAAASPLPGLPPGAETLSPELQKKLQEVMQRSDAALAAARANCKREVSQYPTIGMTETDFKNCTQFGVLSKPTAINETETAAGTSRQYVFRNAYGGIRYIYTRNGVITAIQK